MSLPTGLQGRQLSHLHFRGGIQISTADPFLIIRWFSESDWPKKRKFCSLVDKWINTFLQHCPTICPFLLPPPIFENFSSLSLSLTHSLLLAFFQVPKEIYLLIKSFTLLRPVSTGFSPDDVSRATSGRLVDRAPCDRRGETASVGRSQLALAGERRERELFTSGSDGLRWTTASREERQRRWRRAGRRKTWEEDAINHRCRVSRVCLKSGSSYSSSFNSTVTLQRMITLILKMGFVRLRDSKQLVLGHPAWKLQSQNLKPYLCDSTLSPSHPSVLPPQRAEWAKEARGVLLRPSPGFPRPPGASGIEVESTGLQCPREGTGSRASVRTLGPAATLLGEAQPRQTGHTPLLEGADIQIWRGLSYSLPIRHFWAKNMVNKPELIQPQFLSLFMRWLIIVIITIKVKSATIHWEQTMIIYHFFFLFFEEDCPWAIISC